MAAISSLVAAAGVGLSIYGSTQQTKVAKQQAAVSQQMFAEQKQQEELRRQAMELENRRKTMELIRNQQRARSVALANATSQGASQGSGLQGGYGQIAGQTNTGLLGLSQNLQFGQQMFESNIEMSGLQQQNAALGGKMAEAKGWSSLGGSLFSASSQIGALSKGFGGFGGTSAGPAVWSGGNANPYMRNNSGGWNSF